MWLWCLASGQLLWQAFNWKESCPAWWTFSGWIETWSSCFLDLLFWSICFLLQNLKELGVEMLVLPAVSSVLNTWITSFGFKKMTDDERLQFLGYTFLDFQGTVMCQKRLADITLAESNLPRGKFWEISGKEKAADSVILPVIQSSMPCFRELAYFWRW